MKAKRSKLKVLVVLLGTSLTAGVTKADLVMHWKLDEESGSIVADSSGKGNSGRLQGNPIRVTGRAGVALKFDGTDDCIDLGDRIVEGSFSFALWFQHRTVSGNMPVMNNVRRAAGSVRINLSSTETGAVFRANIFPEDDSRARESIISNAVLSRSQWYHLVVTYHAPTDTASIYVDGALNREMKSFGVSRPHIGPAQFGRGTGAANRFDGIMDDIRIFDNALNANEVALLYSQYFPPASRILIGAVREAEAMTRQSKYREAVALLEKKISEYEQFKQKKRGDVVLHSESLYSDAYFLLAKVKETAGMPIQGVIAAYKQSVSQPIYRPNHVPVLLWLFLNIPVDDYIDVVRKCVRDNSSTLDYMRGIAGDFESSDDWAAFKPFLDAALAEVDEPASRAEAIANGLKKDGVWSNKFMEYCRSKPELSEYVVSGLEKRAQEYVQETEFAKAIEIYRDLASQSASGRDKSGYQFKACECVFNSGQYASALSELDNFIKNNKATNRNLTKQAILLKGRAQIQLDELERAAGTFLQLMIDYPEAKQTPEAGFLVGYCSMLQGKREEAVEALNWVVEDHPQSSYASKARLCLARIKRITE